MARKKASEKRKETMQKNGTKKKIPNNDSEYLRMQEEKIDNLKKLAKQGIPLELALDIVAITKTEFNKLKYRHADAEYPLKDYYQNKFETAFTQHVTMFANGGNPNSKYFLDLALSKKYDAKIKKEKSTKSKTKEEKVMNPFAT